MRPNRSDVHTDALLTQLSVMIAGPMAGFARKIFPVINSDKTSGVLRKWDQGDMMRDEMKPRAPGASAAKAGLSATTVSYLCKEYALDHVFPWETISDDDLAELGAVALESLTRKAMIQEDRAWLTSYWTTSVWTALGIGGVADANPSAKWDNSSGTPIRDLRQMIQGAQVGSGSSDRRAINIVLPRKVMDALADNAEVRALLTPTQKDSLNSDSLQQILECGPVHVIDTIYDSAKEGQTSTPAFIATESALAIYVPPVVSRLVQSAGFTVTSPLEFPNRSLAQTVAAGGGIVIKSWDDEDTESTIYRGKNKYHQVQVGASCGAFAADVLT